MQIRNFRLPLFFHLPSPPNATNTPANNDAIRSCSQDTQVLRKEINIQPVSIHVKYYITDELHFRNNFTNIIISFACCKSVLDITDALVLPYFFLQGRRNDSLL